jgi:hypothetical protein
VVALDKAKGTYIGQFRAAAGDTSLHDIRAWYIEPGVGDVPDTLVWITATDIHQARLASVVVTPGGSPAPSAAPSAGASGAASPPAATP